MTPSIRRMSSAVRWLLAPAGLALACNPNPNSTEPLDQTPADAVREASIVAIRVQPARARIEAGTTSQFRVIGIDRDGNTVPVDGPVRWSISDQSVISISRSGLATGTAIGEADLTAVFAGLAAKAKAGVFRRIAFTSDRDGKPQIYTMYSDGSNQTRLTHARLGASDPAWSPDGSKIAYSRVIQLAGGVNVNERLFLMNADGSGQHQLTSDGPPTHDISPRWSPDGTTILFERSPGQELEETELYAIHADGSGLHSVSGAAPGRDHRGRWSADGSMIAFSSNRVTPNQDDVYTVAPDGTNLVRRTFADDNVVGCWRPAAQVVFHRLSSSPTSFKIGLLDPVTGSVTSLAGTGGLDVEPCWSPDATRIVFRNNTQGHLYLMNAAGGGAMQLTSAVVARFADWSPDGKRIAYESIGNGLTQIRVIAPDGTGDVVLTSLGTNNLAAFRP